MGARSDGSCDLVEYCSHREKRTHLSHRTRGVQASAIGDEPDGAAMVINVRTLWDVGIDSLAPTWASGRSF